MPEATSARASLTIAIGGPVQGIAYSPDGRLLATVTRTGAVRLSEASTGNPVATIMDPGTGFASAARWLWARVWGNASDAAGSSVAFSPDGRLLATGGWDKAVRIWSVATRKPVRVLPDHGGPVLAVAYSPDGKLLAAAGHDKVARLWSMPAGRPAGRLPGHGAHVSAIAFSNDGRRLATGSLDGNVRLWSLPAAELTGALAIGKPVHAVTLSPDGTALVVGTDSDTTFWDLTEMRWVADLPGHKSTVGAVAFSPDGALLATGSWDKTVRVWRFPDREPSHVLAGHTGSVFGLSFDPTSRFLATASYDGTVRVWGPLRDEGARAATRPAGPTRERVPGARPCPACFEPVDANDSRCPVCDTEIDRVAATARRAHEALGGALDETRARIASAKETARGLAPLLALAVIFLGLLASPWVLRKLRERSADEPQGAESPGRETGPGRPATSAAGPEAAPGDLAPPAAETPSAPEAPAGQGSIKVPSGPDAETFRTLRDSRSAREVDRAVATAASRESARLEAEAQYYRVGPGQRARLLRLILESDRPDPSVQGRLEEAYHSGDVGMLAAAIEHDADEGSPQLPQRLSGLGKNEAEKIGRLLGEALLGANVPGDERTLQQLEHLAPDDEIRTRLAPVALLAGDGDALAHAVDDLGTGHGASRRLAERALEQFTGESPDVDALKDAEKALARWQRWEKAASPALDLWRRACADPGVAGVASCQEARVELEARPREAVRALRAFARDKTLRSPASADGLATLLPRVARAADAPTLAAFLAALPPEARSGAPGAVAGSIAAADSAVVAAAGRAILKGDAAFVPLARLLPDLVEPEPDALEGLGRLVGDLPPADRAAALEVRAAFRDGEAVLEQALGKTEIDDATAESALARAGSPLAEDWISRAVLGIERIGRYLTPEAAARGLGDVGTRAAARVLLARISEKRGSPVAAFQALARLGGAAEGKALESWAEDQAGEPKLDLADAALAAAARIGGPETVERIAAIAAGSSDLARLRPLRGGALRALLAVGHPVARDAARRPFVELVNKVPGALVPSRADVAALVRCGSSEDATLLLEALERAPRDDAWSASVLRAVAVLGPEDVRGIARARLVRESGARGEAALVLAREGDLAAAPAIARLLEKSGPELAPEDALALAALATLRPDLAAPLARPLVEKARAPALDAILLALALGPERADGDAFAAVAASPAPERREAVARVVLALARARAEVPGLEGLVARLRLDPGPAVRAEAALVADELGFPSTLEDVLLALDAPETVLARPLGGPALGAIWPVAAEPSLRDELASALDRLAARRGLELELAPGAGRGRIREAQRLARAFLGRGPVRSRDTREDVPADSR